MLSSLVISLVQVRALRLESYRPPKKKRALSLDSVLPNEKVSTPSSLTDGAAAANNSNNSNHDNTTRRRGKSQERADRLSDDAGAAGVVATREGSRRRGDGGSYNGGSGGGGGNSGDNSNAATARGSRESRESLELPCGPFDELRDPRGGLAWVKEWDREGAKALDAAFAKADLENDK